MTSHVSRSWTCGDNVAEAAALDAADEHLLALVVRLPLVPLGLLKPFLSGGMGRVHRRARQLCDRGLLAAVTSPLRTAGRPARLLLPTELGLAALAQRGVTEPSVQIGLLALQRTTPTRLLMALPNLLGAYGLLAKLAAACPGTARLEAWERPWRRALPPPARSLGANRRLVRLPAAATLTWDESDGAISNQYLLVPDTGGLALPAMRGTLGRLAEHQAVAAARATVVVATTTPRRVGAWAALLETVCEALHLPLLTAHVTTWADLCQAARAPDQQRRWQEALLTSERRLVAVSAASPPVASAPASGLAAPTGPRPRRVPRSGSVADPAPALGPLDGAVVDLVGRHAFLSTDSLAAVLGRDIRWARTRRAGLAARGLVRVVPAEEVATPDLARRGLLELKRPGLQVLAALLGLPLAVAVRHHGLAGGGPATPEGSRAALLAHLPQTLGADAVFAALARAARTRPGGGALLEWRSAAACAHGRLRPDGYGLLRLGQQQHGFFLEFDRGSMRPARLRAKFAAYHRYRASARAARDYAGFPAILVVSNGAGAEKRLAHAVRAADVAQPTPLPVLLTTTEWIQAHPEGVLGPIWRQPGGTTRRAWPSNAPIGSGPTGHREQALSHNGAPRGDLTPFSLGPADGPPRRRDAVCQQ